MSKVLRKRISALLVGAMMTASSMALTTGSGWMTAIAAGNGLPATLATSITDPNDEKHPTNVDDCTYMCMKEATDKYDEGGAGSDTTGSSPADLYGDSIKTLKFTFQSEQMVTNFSYYFGASSTKENKYWWDYKNPDTGEAYECTPYATEFSIVIEMPSAVTESLAADSAKFQIQNCYTGLASYDEATKKVTTTQEADITLVSIEANASKSEDTSNGTKPDWLINASDDPNAEKGAENTGGLYYSSANYEGYGTSGEVYSFEENSDGTATVKTTNSLKVEYDTPITLTPGDTNSEEYYATEAGGGYTSESEIRAAGLPLNSHKFTYNEFGFDPDTTVSNNAKILSLSVTVKVNSSDVNEDEASVGRFMYGGGLNVKGKTAADTEYIKNLAGLKDDSKAGYWYNDVGAETLAQCNEAGIEWGTGVKLSENCKIETATADSEGYALTDGVRQPVMTNVGGGTDLAKQNLGSYFTVTWDVPEEVIQYEDIKAKSQISFQLWYAQMVTGSFESCDIVSATLTYSDEITFPYSGQASVSGKSGTISASGDNTAVEIPYSEFNMDYDKTADVYAVSFDMSLTEEEVNEVVFGMGTTVYAKEITDDGTVQWNSDWTQWDNSFVNEGAGTEGKPVLVYWEKTTAGSRASASDDSIKTPEYQAKTGKKEYTFMWIMPPTLAEGVLTDATTGKTTDSWNKVSTEDEEYSKLAIGVWYAGSNSKYTIDDVTVYYAADDANNSEKKFLTEDTLTATPESLDMVIGDEATVEVNIADCTINAENVSTEGKGKVVTAKADADDTKKIVVNAANVGTAKLTITSPGGQIVEVEINVSGAVTTEVSTEEPIATTSASESASAVSTNTTGKTTATTTKSTGTTAEPDDLTPFYGDVNLDGRVDITDAVLLNKLVAGSTQISSTQQKLNADCYNDEDIAASDATTLLQFLVSVVKSLPVTAE